MSAIHGAITSVAIGLSDHINRGVVERTPIQGVLTLVFGGGLLAALAAGFAVGGEPSLLDLGLGALSGLVAAAALVALYEGYRVASAGVVGPPAATLSVVVPVAYDLVGGRLPSALTSAGIIIGAMSVILLSFNPRFEGRRALGLAMAAVSGLLYGTMFIVIDMFDPLAGYWPVVAQRMVAMCCFVVPALVVGRPAMPPRGLRWQAVLGGPPLVRIRREGRRPGAGRRGRHAVRRGDGVPGLLLQGREVAVVADHRPLRFLGSRGPRNRRLSWSNAG